jgi:hypothetical protein
MNRSDKDFIKKLFEKSQLNHCAGDPTISREDARNIAVQMKKIQDEERKNPKPTHDENGLLIMEDDPFE